MSIRLRAAFRPATVFAFALLVSAHPLWADDWPCWRGPNHDGISRETGFLKEWPKDGPRRLWKADLSGGFSSFVVASGRVFTQTKEKNEEVILCLDVARGKELWRHRYPCDYRDYRSFTGGGLPRSRTGPRATPAVDGGRVYTLGATGVVLCLEARTGHKIWRQDLLQITGGEVPRHGFCGPPLLVGDRIYLHAGGPKGKSIAALDKKDGRVAWLALDDPIGYGSPVWASTVSGPQVIFFTAAGAVGVAPKDGRSLWRYPWKTTHDLHIATPIYWDNQVFISSNYGSGAAVFRIKAHGDPETVWKAKTMHNHFTTSVLSEGNLYGFSNDRLRCVDFRTGKIRWDQAGLGRGTVTIADGKLIVLGDHGQLVLARPTPTAYTQISRCQVFDDNTLTWTVPVVSGGRLFVRHENGMVVLDLSSKRK
jgi:outer membrane protein assembly factor BamB